MASRINHPVRDFREYNAYRTAVEPVVTSIQGFVTEELELLQPETDECDCRGICPRTANRCLTKRILLDQNLLEDPHLPTDQLVAEDELHRLMEREIKKLPHRQSLVVALSYEGHSMAAIARQLKISGSAVSGCKKRGVTNLRRSPALRRFFKLLR